MRWLCWKVGSDVVLEAWDRAAKGYPAGKERAGAFLHNQLVNHMSMHIGQAALDSVVVEGQTCVVHAQ